MVETGWKTESEHKKNTSLISMSSHCSSGGSRDGGEEAGGSVKEMLFVERPPEDLTCPICLQVYQNPVLTSCCGNHFCLSCVEQVQLEQRPCPLCNLQKFTTMLDKYFGRKVNELEVWCANKELGCSWQGTVYQLRRHLDPSTGSCKFVRIECPYFCGESMKFSEVESHKIVCPQRPYTCKYCGYKGTFDGMRTKHWSICGKYPVPCPNKCDLLDIPRESLDKHLKEGCLQKERKCEFAYAGCTESLKGSIMSQHLADNLQEHLHLVSTHCIRLGESLQFQSRFEKEMTAKDAVISSLQLKLNRSESALSLLQNKVEALEDDVDLLRVDCLQLRSTVFVPPFEFVMMEFKRHVNNQEQWLSPSFYSHMGGYRMCISLDANGSEEGQGTHISVYVNLMRGEFDNHLQWPFRGKIFIELCNQREPGVNNWTENIVFTYDAIHAGSRVKEAELAEQGLGIPTFIKHADLGFNHKKNTEYLKSDCLRFRIERVDFMNRRSTSLSQK